MKSHFISNVCKLAIIVLLVSCSDSEETPENTQTVNPNIVSVDPELGNILRTPIARFDNLPNYNFEAHYVNVGTGSPLQMHYIDEGPITGKVVLLLHGNPAWVYNFREIIPLLTAAGYRVIAPDLIGFGKSDKPELRSAHTYDRHVAWVTKFIETLNLQNIHANLQDWGGLIGLRVIINNQSRFTKVAVSNTSLPEGNNANAALTNWITSSQTVATYGFVMDRGTFTDLTPEEELAYDAPFPDESFKAAPRQFPLNIPISTTDPEGMENQQLWLLWEQWDKPFLTIFSDTDPISEGEQQNFITRIPGAIGQNHIIVPNTNHFIREDEPQLMATYLTQFFQ
jgi:haloalkane dehalogenase